MVEKKVKVKKTSKDKLKIKDLEKQRDDYMSIAARAQADLVNYRNRVKIEMSQKEAQGKKVISLKVISIIDDFHLALDSISEKTSIEKIIDGLKGIRSKFNNLFENENIKEISDIENFDPNFHEAILTTETEDFAPGSIMKVIRKGYIMNGDVIRPAQVEIAKEIEKQEN
jgi:molecular chaperone GrpE